MTGWGSLRSNFLVFLGFVAMGIASCTQHHEVDHGAVEEIKFFEYPSEVRLPTKLWDLLEEKKIISPLGEIITNPSLGKAFEENIFVGISATLKEKTPGILGGRNIKINGVRAGLLVDLSRYLRKDRGTFYLTFEPNHPIDPSSAQVFFLSHGLAHKIDGQKLGAGCDQFFEVTKAYFSKMKEKGLEVNVTEGRHVSLVAGTFFIRVSHETGVRKLTQVTFTDSRYPELLCDSQGEQEQ